MPRGQTCAAGWARPERPARPTSARSPSPDRGRSGGSSSGGWPVCAASAGLSSQALPARPRGVERVTRRARDEILFLIRAEKVMAQLTKDEATERFEAYRKFTAAIRESGHLAGCNRLLLPETATTVRVRNGKISTTDGPFAETKEQLG